jgi:Alkylmercury lyase
MSEASTEVEAAVQGIAPESFVQRAADLVPEDRALYRSMLLSFSSGVAPTAAGLAGAGSVEAETLASRMRRLQAADLIELDGDGEVVLAYPFSARPTRNRVDAADGRRLWACCAIDALGIPFMLGVAARIYGREPDSEAEVEVSLGADGEPSWHPRHALVLVAWAGQGSTATCACPHINFFTSPSSADRQLADDPDLSGSTLEMREAVNVGRLLFGDLLTDLAP